MSGPLVHSPRPIAPAGPARRTPLSADQSPMEFGSSVTISSPQERQLKAMLPVVNARLVGADASGQATGREPEGDGAGGTPTNAGGSLPGLADEDGVWAPKSGPDQVAVDESDDSDPVEREAEPLPGPTAARVDQKNSLADVEDLIRARAINPRGRTITLTLLSPGKPGRYIGRVGGFEVEGTQQQILWFCEAIAYLEKHPPTRTLIGRVERTAKNIRMDENARHRSLPLWNTVEWNPTVAVRVDGGQLMSPAMALAHEFDHADGHLSSAERQNHEKTNPTVTMAISKKLV